MCAGIGVVFGRPIKAIIRATLVLKGPLHHVFFQETVRLQGECRVLDPPEVPARALCLAMCLDLLD